MRRDKSDKSLSFCGFAVSVASPSSIVLSVVSSSAPAPSSVAGDQTDRPANPQALPFCGSVPSATCGIGGWVRRYTARFGDNFGGVAASNSSSEPSSLAGVGFTFDRDTVSVSAGSFCKIVFMASAISDAPGFDILVSHVYSRHTIHNSATLQSFPKPKHDRRSGNPLRCHIKAKFWFCAPHS